MLLYGSVFSGSDIFEPRSNTEFCIDLRSFKLGIFEIIDENVLQIYSDFSTGEILSKRITSLVRSFLRLYISSFLCKHINGKHIIHHKKNAISIALLWEMS